MQNVNPESYKYMGRNKLKNQIKFMLHLHATPTVQFQTKETAFIAPSPSFKRVNFQLQSCGQSQTAS